MRPGGSPSPAATDCIRFAASSRERSMASLTAATTRSCSISTSPATSGSMVIERSFCWPVTRALTAPPPAEASTSSFSRSAWTFAIWLCICCICFSIFIWFCISRSLLQRPNSNDLGLQLPLGSLDHGILLRCQGPGRRALRRHGRGVEQAQVQPDRRAEPRPHQRFHLPDALERLLVVEVVREGEDQPVVLHAGPSLAEIGADLRAQLLQEL